MTYLLIFIYIEIDDSTMSTSENISEISTGNGDYYMVYISLDHKYSCDSIGCLLIDDILCTINLNKILSTRYISSS